MPYTPVKFQKNTEKNGQKVSLQVNPNQYYGTKTHPLTSFKLAVSMSVDKDHSSLGDEIKQFFEKNFKENFVYLEDHSDSNAKYFLIYFKDLSFFNSAFKSLLSGLKLISFVKKEQMSVNEVKRSAKQIVENID